MQGRVATARGARKPEPRRGGGRAGFDARHPTGGQDKIVWQGRFYTDPV